MANDNLSSIFKGVSVTRINALLACLACMLDQRTSCLNKASQVFNKVCGAHHPTQKISSVYKAFLRIFNNGNTDFLVQGLFVLTVRLLHTISTELELVLDRTHWEFGGTIKNVLVIGCIYNGVFIPLVFKDLGRKGNSNFKERKALIERFLRYWKLTDLPLPQLYLAGDREFIGEKWWQYLIRKNIQFAFRIKEGQSFHIWLNGAISDTRYKANLLRTALGQSDLTHAEICVLGQYVLDLYICKNVTPNASEKYVYIVTNFAIPENATTFYRRRWTIEVCFKHLKSNGFDMEKNGLQGEFKIELLVAMLSFIYTMCIVKGIKPYQELKKVTFNHNNVQKKYKKISLFYIGFTNLISIVYSFQDFVTLVFQDISISNSNST